MLLHQQLASTLNELKQALMSENLYATSKPSAQALASVEPFCVDTLEIEQWLQFIMLPKLEYLIQNQKSLPKIQSGQGMANIAEVVFTQRGMQKQAQQTISLMHKIDKLLEDK